MARINLLPWREERREQLKREFYTNLAAVLLFAAVLVALAYYQFIMQVEQQGERNRYLKDNISKLDVEVKEIAELKENRAQLLDRMEVIQGLQGNRPVIVRIFDQFVETLPEGVYYTKLTRQAGAIKIEGTAESNNRVSSLMRRLDGSEWFVNPNLTAVVSNPAFGEQANNFNLSVSLETPKQDDIEE